MRELRRIGMAAQKRTLAEHTSDNRSAELIAALELAKTSFRETARA
jgi:hypothetical protein